VKKRKHSRQGGRPIAFVQKKKSPNPSLNREGSQAKREGGMLTRCEASSSRKKKEKTKLVLLMIGGREKLAEKIGGCAIFHRGPRKILFI